MTTRDREADVTERRLKHVYEFLDSANNKKALQEADKLIKKHPNVLSLKGVKALALIRMGKKAEGLEILDALEQQQPTDEFTLQAVTYCLKDLHCLPRICIFYENAVKKATTNEDLMTHLFFSYARIKDFKKQQTTAMQLYKLRPKNAYCIWAIMSVIFQGLTNPTLKLTMFFPLAEKMIKKLEADSGLDLEPEIQLHALIVEMQNKNEEALVILNNNKERLKCMWEWDLKVVELLTKLGRWNAVWELCSSQLAKNTDNWFFFLNLIDSAMKIELSENNANILQKTEKQLHSCLQLESRQDDRTVHLAAIKFVADVLKHKLESSFTSVLGSLDKLIVDYIMKFGKLQCCFTDVKPFLNDLASRKLILDLLKENAALEPIDVTVRLVRLYLNRPNSQEEKVTVLRSFSNLLISQCRSQVDYAIIWIQLSYEIFASMGDTNVMVDSLALAEYISRLHPEDSYIKYVLASLYSRIGVVEKVLSLAQALELKFVQRDTLGYLIYDSLPYFGAFSNFTTWCADSESFYLQSDKESVDAQIQCYRSGAFYKLIEFHEFNITLRQSLSSAIANISKSFYHVLIQCSSSDEIFGVLKSRDNDRFRDILACSTELECVKDLRDFTLLDPWVTNESSSNTETFLSEKQASFSQTVALVNLQYQFIEVLKNVDEWTNKHCQTEALIKSIEEIKKMVEKLTIVTKADSTVKQYLNFPHSFWLCKTIQLDRGSLLLKFLTSFGKIIGESVEVECEISDFIPQLAAILDQSKITDLLPVPNFILAGSYCSQIISMIVSLLLAVCSAGNIMSSSSDAKSGSKKLKKGSQNAIESNGNPTTKAHNWMPWLKAAQDGCDLILQRIKEWEPLCEMPLEHISTKLYLPEELVVDRSSVINDIYGSYKKSLSELRTLIEAKLVIVGKLLTQSSS